MRKVLIEAERVVSMIVGLGVIQLIIFNPRVATRENLHQENHLLSSEDAYVKYEVTDRTGEWERKLPMKLVKSEEFDAGKLIIASFIE